jgi:hypothetical protein
VLGQGSVLLLTSIADRTSPVLRGKWVMEVLLGSPPPPPPPNVPLLEETKAFDEGKTLSTRERMEMHRKNPSCNSCHRVIDPLGLALENFDVTRRLAHPRQRRQRRSGRRLYERHQLDWPGRVAQRAVEAPGASSCSASPRA